MSTDLSFLFPWWRLNLEQHFQTELNILIALKSLFHVIIHYSAGKLTSYSPTSITGALSSSTSSYYFYSSYPSDKFWAGISYYYFTTYSGKSVYSCCSGVGLPSVIAFWLRWSFSTIFILPSLIGSSAGLSQSYGVNWTSLIKSVFMVSCIRF